MIEKSHSRNRSIKFNPKTLKNRQKLEIGLNKPIKATKEELSSTKVVGVSTQVNKLPEIQVNKRLSSKKLSE